MIGHQAEPRHRYRDLDTRMADGLEEGLLIAVLVEHGATAIAPVHHVVADAGGKRSRSAWHGRQRMCEPTNHFGEWDTPHMPSKGLSLARTSSSTSAGTVAMGALPRPCQSALLIWSANTTPCTGSPSGSLTSKAYPFAC
jgi:hypothetical protein